MGSGKTSYGKRLAHAMDFDFIDLDEYIVQKQGRSVNEIFKEEGEDYFRNLEAENLRLFGDIQDTIFSVGGGTPCFNNNMSWINSNGFSLYLKLDTGAIYTRLKNATQKRPLIAGKTKEEIIEFINASLDERESFYSKAKLIVDAKDLSIKKLLELIKNSSDFQN